MAQGLTTKACFDDVLAQLQRDGRYHSLYGEFFAEGWRQGPPAFARFSGGAGFRGGRHSVCMISRQEARKGVR